MDGAAEFAALVVHDLKEPLRGIALDAELLTQAWDRPPGAVRALLESIHAKAQLATHMVDAVYASMYGDSGRTDWQRIEAAVMDSLRLPPGFAVHWTRPLPDVHASLELQYVLRNLVGNAIEHHGGQHGTIDVQAQGNTIEVVDDGQGYRRSAPAHARDERKGFGLALVRRLVEGRGGHMMVGDVAPHGTRVSFTWA